MDELSGTLQDFSGSQLILNTDSASYVFNVSNATLECKGGMITGDEISIIYEGQLSGTDTGSVHVLKVVDEFHKKNKLKKRTAHGQVISLTSNTITIKSKKGKTATYPITGILGSLIPTAIIFAGYEGIINWMNDKFHVVTVFMKFVPIQQIMLYLLPLALLVGIVIGLLGSSITIRKYLKV